MPRAPLLLAALAAALALAPPARADEAAAPAPPPMPLGDVLQVAIRQNPSLQLAAIDVNVADAAVMRASGIDDWVLSGDLTLQRFHTTTDMGGMNTGVDYDSLDVSGAISRSLPTGGSVGLSVSSSHDTTPFSVTSGQWTQSILANVTQPLLQGRGKRIARATVRRSRVNLDAASLNRRAQAVSVLGDVINAYYELAYAARTLEIQQASLELATERLRITQASIKAGATAPSEATAVEQTIASREQGVAQAELAVTTRSLTLRRMVGLEIGPDNLDVTAAAPLSATPAPLDLKTLLDRAYANSPEIAVLAKRAEGATIDVEVADDGVMTRLDAALRAGPTGVAEGFGAATLDTVKFSGYVVRAELTAEHTLGNRAARAGARSARSRVTQAKVNIADAKLQVASALATAVAQANTAARRIELARHEVELAEKNIAAEQSRFDLGRSTNFDIAQRQDELRQAQLGFARANVDYLLAQISIDSITGDLLDKYGVTLADR